MNKKHKFPQLMRKPNGEDILALLIELLAEQENVAIEIEVAA